MQKTVSDCVISAYQNVTYLSCMKNTVNVQFKSIH